MVRLSRKSIHRLSQTQSKTRCGFAAALDKPIRDMHLSGRPLAVRDENDGVGSMPEIAEESGESWGVLIGGAEGRGSVGFSESVAAINCRKNIVRMFTHGVTKLPDQINGTPSSYTPFCHGPAAFRRVCASASTVDPVASLRRLSWKTMGRGLPPPLSSGTKPQESQG